MCLKNCELKEYSVETEQFNLMMADNNIQSVTESFAESVAESASVTTTGVMERMTEWTLGNILVYGEKSIYILAAGPLYLMDYVLRAQYFSPSASDLLSTLGLTLIAYILFWISTFLFRYVKSVPTQNDMENKIIKWFSVSFNTIIVVIMIYIGMDILRDSAWKFLTTEPQIEYNEFVKTIDYDTITKKFINFILIGTFKCVTIGFVPPLKYIIIDHMMILIAILFYMYKNTHNIDYIVIDTMANIVCQLAGSKAIYVTEFACIMHLMSGIYGMLYCNEFISFLITINAIMTISACIAHIGQLNALKVNRVTGRKKTKHNKFLVNTKNYSLLPMDATVSVSSSSQTNDNVTEQTMISQSLKSNRDKKNRVPRKRKRQYKKFMSIDPISDEQSSNQQSSNQQSSIEQLFIEQSSIEQSSIEQSSIEQSSIEQSSIEQSSIEQSSIEQSSIEQSSIEQSSIKQSSIEQSSIEQSSIEQSSIEQSSIEQSSINQPSVDNQTSVDSTANQLSVNVTSNNSVQMNFDGTETKESDEKTHERRVSEKNNTLTLDDEDFEELSATLDRSDSDENNIDEITLPSEQNKENVFDSLNVSSESDSDESPDQNSSTTSDQ